MNAVFIPPAGCNGKVYTKYRIKHIDVPGFFPQSVIELPIGITPFKMAYLVDRLSEYKIYDTFEELNKAIFSKSHRFIDPDTVVVSEENRIIEYKLKMRFYYLEPQADVFRTSEMDIEVR